MVTRLACLVLAAALAANCAANSSAPRTDAVLLNFTSDSCGYCKQVAPEVRRLELDGVPVRRINIDREPDLATRYNIRAVPHFVVVSSQGKTLARHEGYASYDELRQLVSPPPQRRVPTGAKNTPQPPLTPNTVSAVQPAALGAHGAVERARAATVRLRVHDDSGFGVGSGTIIDTHGDEALVLTCGHLFRDSDGKGRIEVDVFIGNEPKTVAGTLVDYSAEKYDIALVSIRPGIPVTPVPVISTDQEPNSGSTAFSFGCDRGADPSLRDTRITAVDKYVGFSNLEIAGAPIDGRSGGGLFDAEGRLVGVCNAADPDADIGIYAGPGVVQWQLDRVDLSRLYQPGNSQPGTMVAAAASHTGNGGGLNVAPAVATLGGNTAGQSDDGSASEVICIVRGADGESRVVTIQQPTAELMRIIGAQ